MKKSALLIILILSSIKIVYCGYAIVIQGSPVFCPNDSTTLSLTTEYAPYESIGPYQWFLNGTLIPGATNDSVTTNLPGVYQCSFQLDSFGILTNGIDTTEPFTLAADTLPAINFLFETDTFYEGGAPISLLATPMGGTWSGEGVYEATFRLPDTAAGGPYHATYSYTDSAGCMTASELYLYYAKVSGIGRLPSSAFLMYPNPATNTLILENVPQSAILTITSVAGEILYRTIADSGKKIIDISQLSAGIYCLNGEQFIKR